MNLADRIDNLLLKRIKYRASTAVTTENKIAKQRKLATTKVREIRFKMLGTRQGIHQPTLDRIHRETMAGFKPPFIKPTLLDTLVYE